MDHANHFARSGEQAIAEYEERMKQETGINSMKVKEHKSFGLLIEVTRANSNRVPGDRFVICGTEGAKIRPLSKRGSWIGAWSRILKHLGLTPATFLTIHQNSLQILPLLELIRPNFEPRDITLVETDDFSFY